MPLFTNVTLSETIEMIIDLLYGPRNEAEPPKKNILQKLLFIARQGMFLHYDKFYKQTNGVAIGFPQGPTSADYFLRCIEEKIFSNFSITKPI